MNWEFDEEILLIDLYNNSIFHTDSENDSAISALSILLRNRAAKLGYVVDEKFRNIAGVKMKLHNIEYIVTDGSRGLSAFSEMDQAIYQYSQKCPQEFSARVSQLKDQLCTDLLDNKNMSKDNENVDAKNDEKDLIALSDALTFSIKLDINPAIFEDIKLEELELSVRISNRLKIYGIKTIADLLKMSVNVFLSINGIGAKCIREIEEKLRTISSNYGNYIVSNNKSITKVPQTFLKYGNQFCIGNFDCIDDTTITENEAALLECYKEAYEIMGPILSQQAYLMTSGVNDVINMLFKCNEEYEELLLRRNTIIEALGKVPKERWNHNAFGYVRAFSLSDKERNLLSELNKGLCKYLKDFAYKTDVGAWDYYKAILDFLNWCAFDVEIEIGELFSKLFENTKMQIIVNMRAQHKKLEEIGKILNLTRERVRQIEVKAIRYFTSLESRKNIIMKISALRECDDLLRLTEIQDYFGGYTPEVMFLLRGIESQNYYYDSQLDVFIIGDNTLSDKSQVFAESLPDTFHENMIPEIAENAKEEYDLPTELAYLAIKAYFNISGSIYHRNKLTLVSMYKTILEKYYPNGIKVYDEDELQRFRERIINEYGKIKLPLNNRAITARITDIGVLCNRGMYKPKQAKYIPNELSERIGNYIEESSSDIFLMNTIFSIFESELVEVGINNKYHLQGILKELFGRKYIFRRDYLSKDKNTTSIYKDIVQMIYRSPYPISKKQIFDAYPGITEIVVNLAVSDPNIINLFGEYLHTSRLKLDQGDRIFLKETTVRYISDEQPHHIKEIFDFVKRVNDNLLKKNSILWPFGLFSVLVYLFEDEFQFERPYIALNEIVIDRPGERLKQMIEISDRIAIADILEFAKDYHYQINNTLDYLNSFNESHLIIDQEYLASISTIGITENIANQIEQIILMEVNTCTSIASLFCIYSFPKINVFWSEWLIYSALKKWSTRIDVSTTSNQFRQSTPVIAPKGLLDPETISQISIAAGNGSFLQADNLDDIDEILCDLLVEGL